jgi:hypothetical protein
MPAPSFRLDGAVASLVTVGIANAAYPATFASQRGVSVVGSIDASISANGMCTARAVGQKISCASTSNPTSELVNQATLEPWFADVPENPTAGC